MLVAESGDDATIVYWKIGMLIVLLSLSIILSLLPFCMAKCSRLSCLLQTVMLFCNNIAAGAIVGSGFLHMLPDAEKAFSTYFDSMTNQTEHSISSSKYVTINTFNVADYPWSALICCMSTFFLLMLDGLSSHGGSEHDEHKHDTTIPVKSLITNKEAEYEDVIESESDIMPISPSDESKLFTNEKFSEKIIRETNHFEKLRKNKWLFLMKSVITIIAISIHSVFEAFAIGLEKDFSDLIQLFIPVVLHKGFEALTCGVIIQRYTFSGKDKTYESIKQQKYITILFYIFIIMQVLIYSCSTPLGIIIGTILNTINLSNSYYLMLGILLSLASGSFLFIAFFEIIPMALHESKHVCERFVKLIFISLGFALMAVLAIFT